jgi:hypothetical protein
MKHKIHGKYNRAEARFPASDLVHSPRGLWADASRPLVHRRLGMFGAVILLITVVLAVFGPIVVAYNRNSMDFSALCAVIA